MSLRKQAISGAFWTGIQQFGSQGITFVVSVVLARILEPEEFGLIVMIMVFINVSKVVIDAGLSQSLIRTTNPDNDDYSTVFYFNLLGSIVMYLILFYCAPLIANFYNEVQLVKILRWYSLVIIIVAFSNIQMTKLTKEMNFKAQTKIALPSLVVGAIVGIYMAMNGYGVWSLVWSRMSKEIFNTVLLWYFSNWKPALKFKVSKFKQHFKFGVNLTFSTLINAVFSNLYVLIIGKLFPAAQLGFYNRANSLKQLPVQNIGNILNKITFPLFSKIKDDNKRLKKAYSFILRAVIFILAPTLIFMGVLATPLFRFLLTEKWLPAVPYFQILLVAGILFPLHSYNLNVLKVKGRSDLFLRLEIIKKIVLVVIIAISYRWGIYGLLYGYVLYSISAFFINTFYSGKFINFSTWEQIKSITPIFILALLSGLLVYFTDEFLKQYNSDLLRLTVGSTIGVLCYYLLARIVNLSALNELTDIIRKR